LAEAIHATHHVGPEKRIRIEDTPVALTECLSLVQINGELLATLKSVREFVKSELDVRVDSHTLGGVPMGFDYDGPRIIAEARERLERIDVVIAKAEGRGP
jgi:hypothetical protein